MITLALAVWGLVRLKRPGGMFVAATIVAMFAIFVFADHAIGWVVLPALVLAGFALFRRPRATTSTICAAAWTFATRTNWGWETVYEETGACIFPGAWVLRTDEFSEGAVRCEPPA
jgi:hypothetical protein